MVHRNAAGEAAEEEEAAAPGEGGLVATLLPEPARTPKMANQWRSESGGRGSKSSAMKGKLR